MAKLTTTKYILYGNAVLLIIGTVAQTMENPTKNMVMSCLFIAWVALLVVHITNSMPASAE